MRLQDATRPAWCFDFVSPYGYLRFASCPGLMREAFARCSTRRRCAASPACPSAPRASLEEDGLITSA